MREKEDLRALVASLEPFRKVSKPIFYADLFLTGFFAWVPLYFLSVRALDGWSLLLLFLSYVAFFRGTAFIHEVIHFGRKVKGSTFLYNLFFGFPNRIPAYIHEPHKFHHLPNTFGTAKDPEYLFMKGKGSAYFYRPFAAGLVAPLLLIARFGILPIISWAFPEKTRAVIFRRLSTIVVNPAYERAEGRGSERRRALWQDSACALFFLIFVAVGVLRILPVAFFAWWYLVGVVATTVNMYRARVAHRYDNPEGSLSPLAALRDSVTVDGGMASALWAPIGLRYHALHHLAPQIPYHNLGRAHRHLKAILAPDHPYRRTELKSFWDGLRQYREVLGNGR